MVTLLTNFCSSVTYQCVVRVVQFPPCLISTQKYGPSHCTEL